MSEELVLAEIHSAVQWLAINLSIHDTRAARYIMFKRWLGRRVDKIQTLTGNNAELFDLKNKDLIKPTAPPPTVTRVGSYALKLCKAILLGVVATSAVVVSIKGVADNSRSQTSETQQLLHGPVAELFGL